MAKITFIILAHENASHVAELAHMLTGWDNEAHAVIHYDLKSPAGEFAKLKDEFAVSDRVHLISDRLKCGWGDFSLVEATVRALKVIRRDEIPCDRVVLVSGACMPIRPMAELSALLDEHPETEFIESFDSTWVFGGLRHERYQYWHLFNFQSQPSLFRNHFWLQTKVLPKRKFPRGLEPRFGSQWWCLSWQLCEKILDYIQRHPLTYFFFSTTWIPDELFFQTMAYKFAPHENLARRNLTFFQFNDWGKPLVFLDGHEKLLGEVPFFFARKIGNHAPKLREHLKTVALSPARGDAAPIDFHQPYIFPYKQALANLPKSEAITPTLFQHRHKTGWQAALDTCDKSFAVLYGPPQLTKKAAEILAQSPDLTVLGRLFSPGKVDFGPGRNQLKGLMGADAAIRDMDTPLYFLRVMSRCDKLPVIELAPGDDAATEIALLESRNAIVLPIVPASFDEMMRQFYWILCTRPGEIVLNAQDRASPIMTYRSMLKAIDHRGSKDYRERIEAFVDAATKAHQPSSTAWRTTLEFQHGAAVLPIIEAYESMSSAVKATVISDLTQSMPEAWRNSLASLAPIDPDWKILRLNFPASLQEVWASTMQLLSLQTQSGAGVQTKAAGGKKSGAQAI